MFDPSIDYTIYQMLGYETYEYEILSLHSS